MDVHRDAWRERGARWSAEPGTPLSFHGDTDPGTLSASGPSAGVRVASTGLLLNLEPPCSSNSLHFSEAIQLPAHVGTRTVWGSEG